MYTNYGNGGDHEGIYLKIKITFPGITTRYHEKHLYTKLNRLDNWSIIDCVNNSEENEVTATVEAKAVNYGSAIWNHDYGYIRLSIW